MARNLTAKCATCRSHDGCRQGRPVEEITVDVKGEILELKNP